MQHDMNPYRVPAEDRTLLWGGAIYPVVFEFVIMAGQFIAPHFVVHRPCSMRPGGVLKARRGHALLGMILAISWVAGVAAADSFDCLIEPAQTVEVASPVTGLLESVRAKRGDRVTKGQVLALLESRTEQAAADLARFKSAQLGPARMAERKIEFSRRKFNRRRDMAAEKLMSPQERDDAEAEFRLAESELQVAKENREIAGIEFRQQSGLLDLRTIRSPFDGVVVDQIAYPGEVVEPGGSKRAIMRLAQLDPLRVHVILPKSYFGKPAVGMSAEVSPEIPARSRYVAKVRSIDRLIDAASGTFVIYLELPNPKLDIPAGVKCRATFHGLLGSAAPGVLDRRLSRVFAGIDVLG